MRLRDWRTHKKLGFAELARALGIEGVNPGGTLARMETGCRQPDADMVERIVRFTDGAVTAEDMHAVRLAWLKANRPEKFVTVSAPAAEARP
ncbi:helix-turn-helix transcriptional regulator [Aminobacter sp. P9b]|uniref:helix-turn-helix domain-containing protein n=1 Tax=Aminobacter sp. P9b TaxID=3133697 RepID=UPI0032472E44